MEHIRLTLAPYTLSNWQTFASWYVQRGMVPPINPKNAIFVMDEDTDELLGGVCVYMTDGPWMMLEHMSVRPGIGPHLLARIIHQGMQSAKALGHICCKRPFLVSRHPAMIKALQRCGYKEYSACWYAELELKDPPGEEVEKSTRRVRDGYSDDEHSASSVNSTQITEKSNNTGQDEEQPSGKDETKNGESRKTLDKRPSARAKRNNKRKR